MKLYTPKSGAALPTFAAIGLSVLILCSCSNLQTKHQAASDANNNGEDAEVVQIPVDPDEPNVLPIDEERKESDQNAEAPATDDNSATATAATNDNVEQPVDNSQVSQLGESEITLKNYPDIPHHYNRYVQKWLDYFQSKKGSKFMAKYMERSARYLPEMKAILRDNGLPEDLVYISLIESGFVLHARSHVGAVGFWQFMPSTGRRYGLEINALVDERRDPIKSTYAAVRYFRSLYNVFGNWYFAFAAYNGGENRMFHVLMRHDSRDFWTLAETKKLPKETINYIPKFLAARMIAKDPARYGFQNLQYDRETPFVEIAASQTVNLKTLAKELGIDFSDIDDLNPQFKSEFAPSINGKSLSVRVPAALADKAPMAVTNSYVMDSRWIASIRTDDYVKYRVRRGDTLNRIARRNRTTIAKLRELNNFGRKTVIRVGRYIKVPDSDMHQRKLIQDLRKSLKDNQTAKRDRSTKLTNPKIMKIKVAKRRTQHKKFVVIHRGDTLVGISKKYGISLSKILAANDNLHRRSKLIAGAHIALE